jgi:hypothetical protein
VTAAAAAAASLKHSPGGDILVKLSHRGWFSKRSQAWNPAPAKFK